MRNDPRALIDQSIEQLQELSSLFAAEVQSQPRDVQLSPAKRMRKEVLLTISVLLPKLRAARDFRESLIPSRGCDNCDD